MLAIVLYEPSYTVNVGTALRSSFLLGADFFVLISEKNNVRRLIEQPSNTYKVERHCPVFHFSSFGDFSTAFIGKNLIAVEMVEKAVWLPNFVHPRSGVYVFGNESTGLPQEIIDQCQYTIRIPAQRMPGSFNLATSCSLVLYDRYAKALNE